MGTPCRRTAEWRVYLECGMRDVRVSRWAPTVRGRRHDTHIQDTHTGVCGRSEPRRPAESERSRHDRADPRGNGSVRRVEWPVPEGRLLLLDLIAHATQPQLV